MQNIEPFFKWRDHYIAAEDEHSPFFQIQYNEFFYDKQIYNYFIHPQWDDFGSNTLYLKILFADYEKEYAIIEFIGEWNDAIDNDIMQLKREVLETMMDNGIRKFILIGENIFAFHTSDDCYYEEWFQDIEEGWIAGINFREHVLEEIKNAAIDYYINLGGKLNNLNWRNLTPIQVFKTVEEELTKRLG